MERTYIVPTIGTGAPGNERRPKYFVDSFPTVTWSAIDGGAFMLVVAETDDAQHASLVANLDCRPVPFAAGQTLTSGQAAFVRTVLTAVGLSNVGIVAGMTWEEALRYIVEQLQPGLIGQRIRMNGVSV